MKEKIFIVLIAVLVVSSCKKDKEIVDSKTPLEIPTNYTSTNFIANATQELNVAAQLGSLTSYMKKAQDVGYKSIKDSLVYFFSGSATPSLKDVTGTYYINLIESNWFDEIVASSQNTYDPLNAPTATTGGVYVNRLLNAKAKENIQEIEKGLYTAALYNHFVSMSTGTITSSTIDKMLAIIGGNPSFPNSYTGNVASPDEYILKYVSRRDKNDGSGFYSNIKNGFLKLKAAVAAGDNYIVEQNEAVNTIRLNIEKGMAATTINYCYAALAKLSATSPTDAEKASAMHDLGEAVGFVHGLKAVPTNARMITNAQVDEVLDLLLAPSTDKGRMFMFITMPSVHLPQLSDVQTKLKAVYNFSATEMEDFKNNWVSIQGR